MPSIPSYRIQATGIRLIPGWESAAKENQWDNKPNAVSCFNNGSAQNNHGNQVTPYKVIKSKRSTE